MEGLLCKTSSAEIKNETVSLNVDTEVLLESRVISSSKSVALDTDENVEAQETKAVNGYVENDSETVINGESQNVSETASHKTFSPTLIGSAIQAMKNLFSPDKTKSKSVLTPINQQRNAGSPHIPYISGKADSSSSEPTIEISNNVQFAPEEKKNLFQIPEKGGTHSPLTVEGQNNMDETFFTTVSLIDESFHSTVTDLDEHETLKSGNNFIGNFLNNSQNMEFDSYNDTLESNESLLGNTTLKIGNFAGEENMLCNTLVFNAGGNAEKLGNARDGDFFNKNYLDSSGKVRNQILEKNIRNGQKLPNKLENSEEQKNVPHPTPLDATTLEKMNGGVAHIFLNKSFENPPPPQQSDIDLNFGGSNEERDGFVQSSISTTTIVLNSNNSDTLKSEELDTCTPSYTRIEEDDHVRNAVQKSSLSELSCTLPYKQSADSCSYPATSLSPLAKEKKCISEGNSPNHTLNHNKVKLNKSDELLNRRISCEPLDGKRAVQEKNSSVDITLMKNIEASEMTRGSGPFGKVPEAFKEQQSEVVENDSSVRSNTVPVISQQSYTILTHDNRLNRPVIEPADTSGEPFEKQTFQLDGPISTEVETSFGKNYKNTSFSTDDLVKSPEPKQSTPLWEGTNQNVHKTCRPTALKLHSPDNKKHVHVPCDAKETWKNISIHSHPLDISPVDPISHRAFSLENEAEGNSAESNSSRVSQTLGESNKSVDMKTRSNTSRRSEEKSPTSVKMHQTFRRKSLSPESSLKGNNLVIKQSNETGSNKLNATFNRSPPSSKSKNFNSTYTKKKDLGEAEKASQTFNLSASCETSQMNKTYDKPLGGNQLNETFDKKTDSFANKTQTLGYTLESPARNQTFTKENGLESPCPGLEMPELTMALDKNEMAGIPEELEAEGDNESTEGSRTFRKLGSFQSSSKESETLEVLDSCNNFSDKSSKASEESTSLRASFKSAKSSIEDVSTVILHEKELNGNQSVDDLSEKLGRMDLAGISEANGVAESDGQSSVFSDCISMDSQSLQTEEKLLNSLKDDKLRCDPDLVKLIQEQFSPNDIEKICNVVQDLSSLKLSSDILRASEQFDKSFHANQSDAEFKPPETLLKADTGVNPLSPQSLDFLNSIEGKPTGRDLSRESLYVKFDPLVQPSTNSLIDFTKEGEALPPIDASPPSPHSTSICEQLLAISPQKKPVDIVPPLTPLSHKGKTYLNEDKFQRLKELQNEIYFLKNLYAERERTNKAKMEDYENQVAKLTAESCFLTDKLKESNEREKSLVKKMKEQAQSICQLKIIMEEYVKVISKLGAELETVKTEFKTQVETLSQEKDSYMTHLQNTEAAFTDVHAKYEKSKKTIVSLKANEAIYRNTIAEQAQKLEDFKLKAKEAQEKAVVEFQKIQEELDETKAGHGQESARLRAQLRKTELKVEALQESLDQKIKENQQLTAICDELIEGKK